MDWNTYKEQANALRSKGVLPSQIKEQLGPPIFDGEEWHIESDGKGGIKRKRKSARQAGKRKSTVTRNQKAIPKTEGESSLLRRTRAEARARSQSTLHQHTYNSKPSIAEHDVRIASGGTNEYMSISDPDFKQFKDNIEAKLPKDFVADIDDVSGGVRAIPRRHHNKFQPTSQQPGITFEPGQTNLVDMNRQLNKFRTTKAYGMNIFTEYASAIDEITGGHVDRGLQHLVNQFRTKVLGISANPIKNNYR